jgi:predicted nucleotidyltransferase
MFLNFTKNQILLLEVFFRNPEQPHYLGELGRLLGKKPGVFQRELNKLVAEKILKDYYQANSRFFKLNKKYPLFKQLKQIFFKTVGVAGVLGKELKKIDGLQQAFIYGSFAAGKEHGESDIDLCLIGRAKEEKILDLTIILEKKFGREINYLLMTEKEWRKKVKGKNSFVENILKKKTINLL